MVRRYQGYSEIEAAFPARREVPSSDVVMILSFGGRERVVDPRRPHDESRWGPMVTGIWDTYALSALDAGWSGMQIDLPPPGAYAFFGRPMCHFTNTVVALEDTQGVEATHLIERLQAASGWPPGSRFSTGCSWIDSHGTHFRRSPYAEHGHGSLGRGATSPSES